MSTSASKHFRPRLLRTAKASGILNGLMSNTQQFPGLYIRHYDAEGHITIASNAVLAVESDTDVDLVNNHWITHPAIRSTIWAVREGKFAEFLGEFAKWETAQARLFSTLAKIRKCGGRLPPRR